MRPEGGDILICESPEGNAVAIPSWMTDTVICTAFLPGPPLTSVMALQELRTFFDALHARAKCDKPSEKISSEVPDEKANNIAPEAGGAVRRSAAKRGSNPMQLTGGPEQKLEVAVGELLLDAVSKIKREQEGGDHDA